MNSYLMSGFFYQRKDYFGIGFDPEIGERAYMSDAIFYVFFSGLFVLDHSKGSLNDVYGASSISIVEFSDKILRFNKQYSSKSNIIEYTLNKFPDFDGRWFGTWKSKIKPEINNGLVWLTLTDMVNIDFTDPMPIVDSLIKNSFKESEIPFWKEIQELKNSTPVSHNDNSFDGSLDDLPF